MLLKDFINASYAELQIFKDCEILYVFSWNDTITEEIFIDKCGNFTVDRFYAVTAGIIKVIVTD